MSKYVMMVSLDKLTLLTNLSPSLDTQTLRPNVLIAQEQVRQTIGDGQYQELINKISSNQPLTQDEVNLMDYIQNFLIWQSAVEATLNIYMKTVNNGVTTGTDGDGRKAVSIEELKFLRSMLINRAEMYRKQLQEFIRINLGLYPLIASSNSNQVVRSKRRRNYFSGIHLDDVAYGISYYKNLPQYSEEQHIDPPGCDD